MKKVQIIFAGGASFSKSGSYKELGRVQATEAELTHQIGENIATELAPDIDIDFKYLGGDITGANQTFQNWNKLGSFIAGSYHDYDGFVVLHGADTISWAASQLAYSFQNLAKPIIFTDGSVAEGVLGNIKTHQSIITAVQLAAYSKIPEVSVLSSKDILVKGVDTLHVNAEIHAGFISRNNRILAHVGSDLLLESENILSMPEGEFLFVPVDIDIQIKVYNVNSIMPFPMAFVAEDQTSGVVMQVSGVGNVPLGKAGIRETLKDLKGRGIPVVLVTEDTHGYIDLSKADTRDEALALNVIGGGSMTLAAAVTKLRAAISMQMPYGEMAKFMQTDLFGETRSLLPKIQMAKDRRAGPVVF